MFIICFDIHCFIYLGLFKKDTSGKKNGNLKQNKGNLFLAFSKTFTKNDQYGCENIPNNGNMCIFAVFFGYEKYAEIKGARYS